MLEIESDIVKPKWKLVHQRPAKVAGFSFSDFYRRSRRFLSTYTYRPFLCCDRRWHLTKRRRCSRFLPSLLHPTGAQRAVDLFPNGDRTGKTQLQHQRSERREIFVYPKAGNLTFRSLRVA
jgi:hypothetical protein